jgi:formylglycine-generating enzyme required for sulfatase activity
MKRLCLSLLVITMIVSVAKSNNILVSNVSLTGQNTSAGLNNAANFTFVKFNLSWDNSFRLGSGPNNWDAAWVFVKFQITGGTGCTASTVWKHATIATSGHSGPASASIDGVSDTRGVFIYRSSNGSGTNTWTNFQIRWNYGADGVLDACSVTVKVFAVEMVHVPTGSFYLGDGVIGGNGRFEAAPYGAGNVFQVTSGSVPATLGGGAAGSLGNNNAGGMTGGADDFNNVTNQSMVTPYANGFPNGFNKFYCMKYEIGQEQYMEFLNTLTGTQQANRTNATVAGNFHGSGTTSPTARCGVKCISPPFGATPGQYACDLNNNGSNNEVNGDGSYLAMPLLSTPDVLAYLDWAGLRPMTEFELEKACRGALLPVPGEYSGGTTTFTNVTSLLNAAADNELSNTVGANYNGHGIGGPVRAGLFATGTSTRSQAGATWYGIMDMTGNVWENSVSVGNAAGRAFRGDHGNGVLNAAGQADVNYWPGINGNNTLTTPNGVYGGVTGVTGYAGVGFALGTWNFGTTWAPVSNREYRNGWTGLTGRDERNGGRGVRTAP